MQHILQAHCYMYMAIPIAVNVNMCVLAAA